MNIFGKCKVLGRRAFYLCTRTIQSWDAGPFIRMSNYKVPGRSTFSSNVKLQSAVGHSLVQLTQFEGRKLVIQSVSEQLGRRGSQNGVAFLGLLLHTRNSLHVRAASVHTINTNIHNIVTVMQNDR